MRGKAVRTCFFKLADGITPAYAGKRNALQVSSESPQDHPRLCGEKETYCVKICRTLGSPPPMRGKESHSGEVSTHIRITPAYAGKSRQAGEVDSSGEDHPRLCGEKLFPRA